MASRQLPAQTWFEQFQATNFSAHSKTGFKLALDGNTLIVASPGDDEAAEGAGAVYVFVRDDKGTPLDPMDDSWSLNSKLTASDAQVGDTFGGGVALAGDMLLVGARRDDDHAGSVYEFKKINDQWTEIRKIKPSDGAAGDWFGQNLAMFDDLLVATAWLDDNESGVDAGAAYVFRLTDGVWVEEAKLIGSTVTDNDRFGIGIADVQSDEIVVSASRWYANSNRQGSAYVFAFDQTTNTWIETNEITASDGELFDAFGVSAKLQGDFLLLNAVWDDDKTGSVYVFGRDDRGTMNDRTDDQWIELQKLNASDSQIADEFGRGLAMDAEGTIFVGSYYGDVSGSAPDGGSLYIYSHDDNGTPNNPLDDFWFESVEFGHSNSDPGNFGHSIAIDNDTIVVGDQKAANFTGAFHVFVNTSPYHFDASDTPLDIRSPHGNQQSRTVISSMFVDEQLSIVDLDLQLDISHTNVSDIEVYLVHADENGTELGAIQLFSRIGGSGNHFDQTELDDEAFELISNSTAPFAGRFRPSQQLEAFDGQNAYGFWSLEITDYKKPVDGTLNSWSIDLFGSPISTFGITVTPASGLVTTEAGGQDSFDVMLESAPTGDVAIGISSSDPGEGITDVSSLTFTSANWDISQTVTVTGVDDPDVDGGVSYTIVTAAATSVDPEYDGLDADDVGVTNQDDEQAPILTYDSTDTPLAIPDPGTITSIIDVSDDFVITNLNVTLNIDHDRAADMDVFLIAPDGTRVELFTDVGGNGDDFIDTTLDDEASTNITDGSAPFTGNFRPEGNLNDFLLRDTLGTWTLEVTDDRSVGGQNGSGILLNWSFTVETL